MKMNEFETVKVTNFDDIYGIGTGKTVYGKEVFLKSDNIVKEDGRLLTLKVGETVTCQITEINGDPVAVNITRVAVKEKIINKTTFIEPKPLDIQP
jgi:cold shock CspA family protein